VCVTAWKEQTTQVVPDVELFPGHIACSSLSRSEIVVPVWRGEEIVAVLDIDSEHLATFDEVDKVWLERIVSLL
jgi:GAF domain-containing protein